MLPHPVFGALHPAPSLAVAASDPELSHAACRVLVRLWLAGLLDVNQYRPLKVEGLAHGFRVSPAAVSRALGELEARGYLHCGCADPGAPLEAQGTRPRWYRLPYAGAIPA
jgi:hypothetical protein